MFSTNFFQIFSNSFFWFFIPRFKLALTSFCAKYRHFFVYRKYLSEKGYQPWIWKFLDEGIAISDWCEFVSQVLATLAAINDQKFLDTFVGGHKPLGPIDTAARPRDLWPLERCVDPSSNFFPGPSNSTLFEHFPPLSFFTYCFYP